MRFSETPINRLTYRMKGSRLFTKFTLMILIICLIVFLHPSIKININFLSTPFPQRQTNTSTDHVSGPTRQKISDHPRPPKGYIVNSPSCSIPDLDAWPESVAEIVRPIEPVSCSKLPPLTRVDGNTLSIMKENEKLYTPIGKVKCCLQEIKRGEYEEFQERVDDLYKLSECVNFDVSKNLTSTQQFLLVKCVSENSTVYTNMHTRITVPDHIQLKLETQGSAAQEEKKPNVLMIGVDSMSRLNFIRTMPRTLSFLRKTDWVELKGYNKVHDNTLPNLIAVLTGMNYTEAETICGLKDKPLDDCPFIWKKFSEHGYVTALGDDGIDGTFNFKLKGFKNPPTDYYLRPFIMAGEKETTLKYMKNSYVCFGPTLTIDHVNNYAADFTKTFRDNPYFALFWTIGLSHDDVNFSGALDLPMLRFFQNLSKQGTFEDTIVVFFSDHGMRYGEIRTTHNGWLEERLPFNFIWVPEKFRNSHPEKYNNLLANRDKLTSTFDLHLTLQEILNNSPQKGTVSCPDCVSLLQPVPTDRSCKDAGIPEHFCACSSYTRTYVYPNETLVQEMVQFTIQHLNGLLQAGRGMTDNNTECATLSLKKVLSVWSKGVTSEQYVVAFETLPGPAMYEATLSRKGGVIELLGPVSRTNVYGHESKCILNDQFLRMYCYCEEKRLF